MRKVDNMSIKVSVILPIYNVEKYLEQCLESLVHQTLKEIEIICVNDGSTDNSLNILDNYSKMDSRIVVINKKNGGTGSARNVGIKAAQGEYIGFIDPDDWVDLSMFEKLYNQIEKNSVDIVMCSIKGFNDLAQTFEDYQYYADVNFISDLDNKIFTWQDISPFKIPFSSINKIYNKQFIDKYKIEFAEGLDFEDHKFIFMSMIKAKGSIFIREPLYIYRYNRKGSVTTDKNNRIIDHLEIIDIVENILKTTNAYNILRSDFFIYKISNYICWYNAIDEKYKKDYFYNMKKRLSEINLTETDINLIENYYWYNDFKMIMNNSYIILWTKSKLKNIFLLSKEKGIAFKSVFSITKDESYRYITILGVDLIFRNSRIQLENKIKELSNGNKELSDEIRELNNENKELSDEIRELNNENKELSDEIKKLSNENKESSNEIRDLSFEFNRYRQIFDDYIINNFLESQYKDFAHNESNIDTWLNSANTVIGVFYNNTIEKVHKNLPILFNNKLNVYDVRESIKFDLAYIWGIKPYFEQSQIILSAKQANCPVIIIEDGFLRSACTWANEKVESKYRSDISFNIDDLTVYSDATRPSRLELMLNSNKIIITEEQKQRARYLIDKIISTKLTKYNHQPIFKPQIGRVGSKKVLIVDQSYGDMSIQKGLADERTFKQMLKAAIEENPEADIIIKTHPDVLCGNDSITGYYTKVEEEKNIYKITYNVNPISLIQTVDKVYVCTTQLGFEAAMCGKDVHVFGMPFYAGWGITSDRQACSRRNKQRTLEEIFYITYIMYSRYINPKSKSICEIEEAIDYLLEIREEFFKEYSIKNDERWMKNEFNCQNPKSL
jgi:capsular polysaccharide export protein